jgi:hypothetical protein
MLMNFPRRIIKLSVLINCRYSQRQGRKAGTVKAGSGKAGTVMAGTVKAGTV